ncbi:MAG: sulfatase [Bryobacteraceae bacterium]
MLGFVLTKVILRSAGGRLISSALTLHAGHPALVLALYMGPLALSETLINAGHNSRILRLAVLAAVISLVVLAGFAGKTIVERSSQRRLPKLAMSLVILFALSGLALSGLLKPGAAWEAPLSTAHPGPKPNVILIVMDTVRADHLSVYGYGRKTSPNLETFAKSATVFTNATATADWTLPTHSSMFTGLYPKRHGAHFQDEHVVSLDQKFETLAERLSRKGFATSAIVANSPVVSKSFGLHQGFQHFDQSWNPFVVGWSSRLPNTLRGTVGRLRRFMPSPVFTDCRTADKVNAAVYKVIPELQAKERPFFLFLNYMEAHSPYPVPAPFDKFYGQSRPVRDFEPWYDFEEEVLAGKRSLTVAEKNEIAGWYDSALTALDSELNRLFEYLKSRDLFDGSLIVITADHGEALGARGLLEHGGLSLYRDQIHIPMIVKFPGQRAGSVDRNVVSQVDIVPSVLDVLGYGVPAGLEGRSLARATGGDDRLVFSISHPQPDVYKLNPKRFKVTHEAALSNDRKFITSTDGTRQLYDLSADAAEENNLATREISSLASFETSMREWRKSATTNAEGTPAPISPEALERLKSLGYVQGK